MPLGDGPCVGLEERCDPLAPEPCCDPSHRCSGADELSYRCYPPCEASRCSYGSLIGTCGRIAASAPVMCFPVGPPKLAVTCVPETLGCTTEYGATGDTACFEEEGRTYCLERCAPAVEICEVDRPCVPLAFEPGGVCSF